VLSRSLMKAGIQFFAVCVLALSANAHAAQSFKDGPYVGLGSEGDWIARWVRADAGAPHVREERIEIGDAVLIPAVGALPAFTVELQELDNAVPTEVALPKGTPLFVMADTHGEFEIAAELLQQHGIINEDLHWSFGTGRLVILGDVFDRGDHQTELLWLIYKLEAAAKRAGGAVHLLLGNHELLVLMGDERYLNPKYTRTAQALGAPRYAALWDTDSFLGRWLRTKAATMKIGDYLCAHGGLSPEAAARNLTLDALNDAIRDALNRQGPSSQTQADRMSFAIGPAGPLWYRGYFSDMQAQGGPPRAGAEEIMRVLDYYKAKYILVGHTRVPTITSLYGGDVIAVQVYPHRHAETGVPVMEALSIEGDRFFKARADGSREVLKTVE